MISYLFLTFAAIHIVIWVSGWIAWSRNERPQALFLILFSGTLLFYDNLRIGLGRFIGEGEVLQTMTAPAFIWHWLMLPVLIIAVGIIARRAGFGWAQSKFAIGAFCLLATALIALEVPLIWQFELHPACLADTLRYTTTVKEVQLCGPDDVPISGVGSPIAPIVTCLVALSVGIALWVRARWPWMALAALAMLLAAGVGGRSYYALPIANFGEILFTLGLVLTALRFTGKRSVAAA